MWAVYLIIGVLAFWAWFFFGFRGHCPDCGVELPEELAYPGQKVDRCPRCGWTSRPEG